MDLIRIYKRGARLRNVGMAIHAAAFFLLAPLSAIGEMATWPKANNQIVEMTNAFRAEKGLEKLVVNDELQATAVKFAEFMALESKYGHGADGRAPAERAEAEGYDYCLVRENIAYRIDPNQPDDSTLAEGFVSGWKDSEEHRENMLGKHIRETGVAVASADGETFYAVQLFGLPESAKFEFEIKNESNASQVVLFRSGDSRDEINIPPRSLLKIARCLPTTIALVSTKAKQTVSGPASFAITQNAEGDAVIESR